MDVSGNGTEVAVCRLIPQGENIDLYVMERRALLSDDRRTLPQPDPLIAASEVEQIREMVNVPSIVFPHLEGPRTADWLLSTVAQMTGAGFTIRHQRWVAESGVGGSDRSTFEHQLLSKVMEAAISVDRLNCKNLMCVELVLRRMQLIEEVIAENPSQPSWDHAQLYMGWTERRGGALVAPSMRSHVAARLSAETAVMKERRKAREAKGAGKGKKEGKGE